MLKLGLHVFATMTAIAAMSIVPFVAKGSDTENFKTFLPLVLELEVPPPPSVVAPPNGAQLDTVSPTFIIDNSYVGIPARAEFICTVDPEFSMALIWKFYEPFQGRRVEWHYSNLPPGTALYCRARSSFDGTTWGRWSDVTSSRIVGAGGPFPTGPALLLPPAEAAVDSLRPTVTWSPSTGATGYAVWLRWRATLGVTFINDPAVTSFTIPYDLLPNDYYTWWVTARNYYGWGVEREGRRFHTPSN